MSDSSSFPASPSDSTAATSLPPSPALSKLSLDVTEEDRQEATKVKLEANKAFTSTFLVFVFPPTQSDDQELSARHEL